MSGSRLVLPNAQVTTAGGPAGVGYKLYFYETGTDTPQNTYQDVGLTTPNTNPIVADARGDFGNVFLLSSPAYRMVLTDADGVQIWTMDPCGPGVGSSATGGLLPIGAMVPYGGTEGTIPSGWLICAGQAVSRTVFAALFAIIGASYGAGDGSTTFNIPDKRGRVSIGKDDMGGSAAGRVTAGGSGIAGTTLGGSGGSQLTQAHSHSITDPGHTHTLVDPGHAHLLQVASAPSGGSTGAVDVTSGAPAINHEALIDVAGTGISVNTAATGITGVGSYGSGTSQNMPPGQVDNWIIRSA